MTSGIEYKYTEGLKSELFALLYIDLRYVQVIFFFSNLFASFKISHLHIVYILTN